ncbi:MAG: hypothetical protein C4309_00795, partial [Chloroflexota bacterium]
AGPALNPMIKVVNLVSVIIAPIIVTLRTQGLSPVIILVVLVLAAIVGWAIWQSKREVAVPLAAAEAEVEKIPAIGS